MTDLDTKREALAALVAESLGFDPAALDPGQQAVVDRKVEALADASSPEPGQEHLHEAARAYRDARQLRADEDNVRLAERGEVFAPEDDA